MSRGVTPAQHFPRATAPTDSPRLKIPARSSGAACVPSPPCPQARALSATSRCHLQGWALQTPLGSAKAAPEPPFHGEIAAVPTLSCPGPAELRVLPIGLQRSEPRASVSRLPPLPVPASAAKDTAAHRPCSGSFRHTATEPRPGSARSDGGGTQTPAGRAGPGRAMASGARGAWSEWPVDHFLRTGHIAARDGAAVRWFHAANSRARAAEAAQSDVHMVEVDVVLRGGDGDPILAHPPDTDSDITLQEWLAQMGSTNKGIKLDFKSLAAVGPSLELLGQVGQRLDRPVWLNGDVLPGPCGSCAPLDARAFLSAVTAACPEATLSLGWTTGCHRGQGYAWPAVQEMWRLCGALSQPVTFAVRAALVPGSLPPLQWLLQQCHRFSLTVWTGKEDVYSVEDLLLIRENFDKSRVYYDIFEPQNSEFKKAIGIE